VIGRRSFLGMATGLPLLQPAAGRCETNRDRRLADNRILFEEHFDAPLNFRSGGPTDRGFYRGSGLWMPCYFWAESSPPSGRGHGTGSTIGYGTDKSEGAWSVDPTSPIIAATGYSPFSVSKSQLRITTQTRPAVLDDKLPINAVTGTEYAWVNGLVSTRHSVYFKPPVYLEVRAKFPAGKSLWGGVVIYGQETNGFYYFQPPFEPSIPWAVDKPAIEIDVAEYISEVSGPQCMHHAWHWSEPGDRGYYAQGRLQRYNNDLSADFHDYGVLWEDKGLTFFVDGQESYRSDLPAGWTNSYAYILLGGMTVGGRRTWASPPGPATPNPAYVYYDSVRVRGTDKTPFVRRLEGVSGFLG
jgi:hypothetical protein